MLVLVAAGAFASLAAGAAQAPQVIAKIKVAAEHSAVRRRSRRALRLGERLRLAVRAEDRPGAQQGALEDADRLRLLRPRLRRRLALDRGHEHEHDQPRLGDDGKAHGGDHRSGRRRTTRRSPTAQPGRRRTARATSNASTPPATASSRSGRCRPQSGSSAPSARSGPPARTASSASTPPPTRWSHASQSRGPAGQRPPATRSG